MAAGPGRALKRFDPFLGWEGEIEFIPKESRGESEPA